MRQMNTFLDYTYFFTIWTSLRDIWFFNLQKYVFEIHEHFFFIHVNIVSWKKYHFFCTQGYLKNILRHFILDIQTIISIHPIYFFQLNHFHVQEYFKEYELPWNTWTFFSEIDILLFFIHINIFSPTKNIF